MKFLSQFIVVIFLSAFFACNSNKNSNPTKDETEISIDETSTEVKIKTYVYPSNLFTQNNTKQHRAKSFIIGVLKRGHMKKLISLFVFDGSYFSIYSTF